MTKNITFVGYDALGGLLRKTADYKYRGQAISIEATIVGPDPTIITPVVRRAVLLASGMTEAQCDALDAVTEKSKLINGQSVKDVTDSNRNTLLELVLTELGYIGADGKVNIP